MGNIKIVREKKIENYTFVDDSLDLIKSSQKKEELDTKKKIPPDYRLRDNAKINKLKKSKITGGHTMQGHSPVYE
jgi:hypothetical protein